MDRIFIADRTLYSLSILGTHLSDQELKDLNIKCTGLDLVSGKPADGTERFIVPFPTSRIDTILKQKTPWIKHMLFANKCQSPRRRVDALTILYTISGYLWHTGAGSDSSLIEETDWDTRPMEYDEGELLSNRTYDGPDWEVVLVLDKFNGRTPHISCLLTDEAPLRDDQLSNAEIWCIVEITRHRLRLQEYQNLIIPVTVISASDTKLRVVQGFIDSQGYIQVRKSQIIDFEGVEIYYKDGLVDDQNGLKRIELVLSWCMGETVGCTEFSHARRRRWSEVFSYSAASH